MKSGALPDLKVDLSEGFTAPLTMFRTLEKQWPTPGPVPEVAEITDLKYPARDGTMLDLCVFHAAGSSRKEAKPVVVYFHGGGGVMGFAYSVAPLARMLVQALDCVVVSPQYRLAPEHGFPTGVEDAWDAVAYLATQGAAAVHGDIDIAQGLVVGGASHGAVLSSLVALRAKDSDVLRGKITGLFFAAGAFISDPDTIPAKYRAQYLSRTDEKTVHAPILNKDTKAMFDMAYAADTASPLYRAFNNLPLDTPHAGVAPKAYFQVCGADILRDDSLIYAAVLEELGVEVQVDVYKGAPHVFWGIFSRVALAQRWRDDTVERVRWLLGGRGKEQGGKM